MSGEGFPIAADARFQSDLVQCCTCDALHQGVPVNALPDGWDAFFLSGAEPALFCPACIAAGRMELFRAAAQLPRRQQWAFPTSILSLYRPATREILIATPDGMAAISERDAEALVGAISVALAERASAGRLPGAHA